MIDCPQGSCAQLTTHSHSVKGPELISMYVGQSEENVREGEQLRQPPALPGPTPRHGIPSTVRPLPS